MKCEASNYMLDTVLTQEGEDGGYPIAYISCVPSATERNYKTKKCLAVLWAMKKLRPYLKGYQEYLVFQ